MTEVIDSYNFFINTDRNQNSDAAGDNAHLNLGLQPITCGDDEFIRLSVQMFAMRRSWTDINSTNAKFNVFVPEGPPPQHEPGMNITFRNKVEAELPHIDTTGDAASLYEAFMIALEEALKEGQNNNHQRFKVKFKTFAQYAQYMGMTDEMPSLKEENPPSFAAKTLTFKNKLQKYKENFCVILEDTKFNEGLQYPPLIQCPISKGDSYLLFGGRRVYDETLPEKEDTAGGNLQEGYSHKTPVYIEDDRSIFPESEQNPRMDTNHKLLLLEFPYNFSYETQKMIYITTSQVNNNIATDSFTAGSSDTRKGSIESSQIMAAVKMQHDYLEYTAGTDHNYFVNFTTKQANLIKFSIVDCFGRRLPLADKDQAHLGNRSFEMCVRVDRCRRVGKHPYDLETKPTPKPTPPRLANGPANTLRHGIPGFGLNVPGQMYGDGYKPVFEN